MYLQRMRLPLCRNNGDTKDAKAFPSRDLLAAAAIEEFSS